MATNLSRAATVSAASGYQRRRGSFTADWTDSHSLSKHSFDKRVSRDDLALILKSSKKGNVTAFHIPIHGRLPSPEHSPRTSSLTRTTWVRTSTPDSMIDSGETGVIAVGMAIGSPTQMGDFAPAPWNPQNRAMNAVVDIPEPIPEPAPEPVDDTQQKARKWGLFRSKSKRATRPEKPQRSMTESVNTSTTSLGSSGMPTSAPADQSSRKMPKHKPIVIRSQTEPIISEPAQTIAEVPQSVPTSAEAKPISPGKLTKEKPALQRKASKEAKLKDPGSGGIGRKMSLRGLRGDSSKKRSEKAIAPPPSSPPPMPAIPHSLLDVEIPSIKMDRYSVMFNSVLQPPQGSASSLLARRQATLDHLKSVKDAIAENRDESLRHGGQRRHSPHQLLFPRITQSLCLHLGSEPTHPRPYWTHHIITQRSPLRQLHQESPKFRGQDLSTTSSQRKLHIISPPLSPSSTDVPVLRLRRRLALLPQNRPHLLCPLSRPTPTPNIRLHLLPHQAQFPNLLNTQTTRKMFR
uniref:Uncharacterized protein n=1 Tax=Fusarium oxysporum (strain Fo5176) TaxID=660025 RepID=A0A0D2XW51_FUSOF